MMSRLSGAKGLYIKSETMVSVIIPALNEEETIGAVVRFCFQEPCVSEVIVVDDKSEDQTVAIAVEAGARVVVSEVRGKGVSMRDGIKAASNQVLVFLDADIHTYPEKTISKLVAPILVNGCDFVKGAFARNAGRVTELVAKPLLKIFFPDLAVFQQPLSGMIAGKKSYFTKIDFFPDYGVDIGILIDMYLLQARVKEVNIGYIENKSKPWQLLGKMSGEVSRAIIRKASSREPAIVNLEALGTVNVITGEMEEALRKEMVAVHKLVVFNIDDTLLRGRFIDTLAEKYQFTKELLALRQAESDPAVLTKRIARLIKGLSMNDLLQVADAIPLVEDAERIVADMKGKGNIIGVISHSYQLVADFIKTKVGADFAIGNSLSFFEGKATGEITIPSVFYNNLESCCNHSLCKTNALMHSARKFGIRLDNCIAIGHGDNDSCMVEQAGMGIAFCTSNEKMITAADKVISHPSFESLVDL
jgi:glucosyl-3-phosphoglycerate synthase